MQMEISFTDLARLESECQQLRNEVLHYKSIETQYLALQVSRHTTLLLGKGLTATQL
ncbi:uncharacterized protein LOC143255436 isoform X4 [Tachypleus tridentatus]|uniref:uncharacterized protein LOC143255436 isoform X4 n=1 Tax=Tachypleus tridentatus TaxID=6853 RepID=UPI003FD2EA4F